jgi:hypothetical protein
MFRLMSDLELLDHIAQGSNTGKWLLSKLPGKLSNLTMYGPTLKADLTKLKAVPELETTKQFM